MVNYAAGAARADEVVAEVKAMGGEAIAVGGRVEKASQILILFFPYSGIAM